MRRRLTLPEVLLWARLKPSINGEFNIRRQHPVRELFVVDFFYEDLQIAFEIDGKFVHGLKGEHDAARQQSIEATGVAFVRIPASSVLRNPDEVAKFILDICAGVIALEDLDEKYL